MNLVRESRETVREIATLVEETNQLVDRCMHLNNAANNEWAIRSKEGVNLLLESQYKSGRALALYRLISDSETDCALSDFQKKAVNLYGMSVAFDEDYDFDYTIRQYHEMKAIVPKIYADISRVYRSN